MAAQQLLQALKALPEDDDFRPQLSLLNQTTLNEEPVRTVVEMYTLLKSGRFKDYWQFVTKNASSLTSSLNGFDLPVKKFIAGTVQVTYQTIKVDEFAGWLNLKPDQVVAFLQKEMQWKDCVVGEAGKLRLPLVADNNMKSTVIMESLKIEQFSKIIGIAI